MCICKTCTLLATRDSGNSPLWDCILRTPFWDLVHSYNTSLKGWLVLVARRHIEAIDELTEDEATELGVLIRRVSIALKQVVGCQKTYIVQFAEHPDHPHVHVHVVPRMADLPAQGRGSNIFSYLGVAEEVRLSVSEMNEVAAKIQSVLKS